MGTNYGRPLFGFTYCEAPSIPFKYTWYPGTLLSDSTIQQPLAYVPKSIKYTVKTMGRSGCIIKDSADIYIPVHDYSVTPIDTAICFGETAPLHAKNGFTYKWYEYKDGVYTLATRNSDCWDCADPILRPQATTIYKIVVYDSVWCTDTLTARVEVMPLPDIRILNRDTIVKYGQGLQLMVSGARMYNWLNPSSLSNTSIANPVARPTEPTQYVVGGIGRNGCRAFDTLNVAVDYRDNLFIPSAFSPNGDGKNDVFKITNLSFQRVMEFRVFNRWGQEVFYSNDNMNGWDGNWKGVPQDMGSYTYMIRLGYPDGLVESFKGEVTLVR
jgi:gliding motility-associated-like protein